MTQTQTNGTEKKNEKTEPLPPPPLARSVVDTKAMKGAAAVNLPLSAVWADHARNPRQETDADADADLLASIRERARIIEPICVVAHKNPKGPAEYRVTKGYRRYRAAVALKMAEIPCVIEVMKTGEQEFEEAIEENEKRSNFSIWDRVSSIGFLNRDGRTPEDIGRVLANGGVSVAKSTVYLYSQVAKGLDAGVRKEMSRLPASADLWKFACLLTKKSGDYVTKDGLPKSKEQVEAWAKWRADWEEKTREKSDEEKEAAKKEKAKKVKWHVKADEAGIAMYRRAKAMAKAGGKEGAQGELLVATLGYLLGQPTTMGSKECEAPEWYAPKKAED